jgi:hypothetical protein
MVTRTKRGGDPTRGSTVDAESVVRRLWRLIDARDWDGARALLDDDFVADLPVSGERFVGPDAYIRMNREYLAGWAITVVRVVGAGERAASEVRVRLAGKADTALSFYELRDGLVTWIADWWPEPYPAPPPRAHLASPPPPPDPRLAWLDFLDDARCELIRAVAAVSPEELIRLATWDEAATANVHALIAGESPPGWGDESGKAADERPTPTPDQALALLYRARADLRMALLEAPMELWSREPVEARDGNPISLPEVCRILSERDRKHAANRPHVD